MNAYRVEIWNPTKGVSVAIRYGCHGHYELLRHFHMPAKRSECLTYVARLMSIAATLNRPECFAHDDNLPHPQQADTDKIRAWCVREVGRDPSINNYDMTASRLRALAAEFAIAACADGKVYVLPGA